MVCLSEDQAARGIYTITATSKYAAVNNQRREPLRKWEKFIKIMSGLYWSCSYATAEYAIVVL